MKLQGSAKPRGRPKSREKHARILQAAGECFLALGLSGTSMDEVANRAGVSKQTVYSHFHGKEELFQAVIRNKCDDHQIAPERLALDGGLEQGLLRFTQSYLTLILDPDVVAMTRQLAAQSAAAGPEMSQLFYAAGPAPTIQCIAEFLAAHREAGELAIDDPQETAADYVHETGARFKFELMMGLRETVSQPERDAHAQRRVRHFLLAYGARPPDV